MAPSVTRTQLTEERLPHLNTFQALLPEVREIIHQHIPSGWPEFAALLSELTAQSVSPLAVLPLASCAAAGGNPRNALPLAAAWTILNWSIRLLDDAQDQDISSIWLVRYGTARTINFSVALYTLSNQLLATGTWSAEMYRQISQQFMLEGLQILAGQDSDLRGATQTVEAYWQTIVDKNARLFALICATGAQCGSRNTRAINGCRTFGFHLGIALQLFDDLEGLWQPSHVSDIARGKITLPLLYGLHTEHPGRKLLQRIIQQGLPFTEAQIDEIRAILDSIHTRQFMVWAALQERQQAHNALSDCVGQAGITALSAYVSLLFADIEIIADAAWPTISS